MLKRGLDEPVDEKYARESFTRYLNDTLNVQDIVWEKSERPDYYLTIGGDSFAVEVTQTQVLRDTADGTCQVVEGTYQASHATFVEEVKQAAKRAGILNGTYMVRFQRPMAAPARRFEAAKSHVEKELLDYIRQTELEDQLPTRPIFNEGVAMCWITKLSAKGSLLEEVFLDAAWTESPEFMDKVCRILQEAILRKKRLLEDEARPKILLLLNTYPPAYPSTYRRCLRRVESVGFFHSIFAVEAEQKVFLLHDRDNSWPDLN